MRRLLWLSSGTASASSLKNHQVCGEHRASPTWFFILLSSFSFPGLFPSHGLFCLRLVGPPCGILVLLKYCKGGLTPTSNLKTCTFHQLLFFSLSVVSLELVSDFYLSTLLLLLLIAEYKCSDPYLPLLIPSQQQLCVCVCVCVCVCMCVCVYQHGTKPSKETYKTIPHNNSIDNWI